MDRHQESTTLSLLELPNELLLAILLDCRARDLTSLAQACHALADMAGMDSTTTDARVKSDLFWHQKCLHDIGAPQPPHELSLCRHDAGLRNTKSWSWLYQAQMRDLHTWFKTLTRRCMPADLVKSKDSALEKNSFLFPSDIEDIIRMTVSPTSLDRVFQESSGYHPPSICAVGYIRARHRHGVDISTSRWDCIGDFQLHIHKWNFDKWPRRYYNKRQEFVLSTLITDLLYNLTPCYRYLNTTYENHRPCETLEFYITGLDIILTITRRVKPDEGKNIAWIQHMQIKSVIHGATKPIYAMRPDTCARSTVDTLDDTKQIWEQVRASGDVFIGDLQLRSSSLCRGGVQLFATGHLLLGAFYAKGSQWPQCGSIALSGYDESRLHIDHMLDYIENAVVGCQKPIDVNQLNTLCSELLPNITLDQVPFCQWSMPKLHRSLSPTTVGMICAALYGIQGKATPAHKHIYQRYGLGLECAKDTTLRPHGALMYDDQDKILNEKRQQFTRQRLFGKDLLDQARAATKVYASPPSRKSTVYPFFGSVLVYPNGDAVCFHTSEQTNPTLFMRILWFRCSSQCTDTTFRELLIEPQTRWRSSRFVRADQIVYTDLCQQHHESTGLSQSAPLYAAFGYMPKPDDDSLQAQQMRTYVTEGHVGWDPLVRHRVLTIPQCEWKLTNASLSEAFYYDSDDESDNNDNSNDNNNNSDIENSDGDGNEHDSDNNESDDKY